MMLEDGRESLRQRLTVANVELENSILCVQLRRCYSRRQCDVMNSLD